MTPFVSAVVSFGLTTSAPGLAALFGWRRAVVPTLVPNQATRVHEAGHAIVAWHCTAVVDVLTVNTEQSGDGVLGGHVRSAWLVNAPQPALDWCRLVVTLGGVAAEMMVIRRARSKPSSGDLMEAVSLCRRIVQAGGVVPPWSHRPRERRIAFERVFVEQLTEEELRVMRFAYAMARDLLAQRSSALARLLALLVERPIVRGDDLYQVLGLRPVASTSLWRTLSNEVRAEFSIQGRTL
jgi:ATP-dependent Zn protease